MKDGLIALRLAADGAARTPAPHEIVVVVQDHGTAGERHAATCSCCHGVPGFVTELRRLAIHRARGETEFDAVVVCVPEGERDAIAAAIRRDPFIAARYRLAAG
jgi:hypothetical protein